MREQVGTARVVALADTLALAATAAGTLLVLIVFAPALEAPFLVPKFAVLEIAASLGAVAFAARRTVAPSPSWHPLATLGVALVVATSLVAWMAAGHAPYALAALLRWGALFGLAAGASVVATTEHGPRQVLTAVTVGAATVAAVGLLQHVGLMRSGIPVFSLPGSTFGNRNLAAEVMAMALPFGVSLALVSPRGERLLPCTAVALELVFLGATRARGAWLGAASGLILVLWLERGRLSRRAVALGATLLLAASLAAALPGRWSPHDAGDSKRYAGVVSVLEAGVDAHAPAVHTRLGLWHRTLRMIGDHPWLGVGPGNWPVAFPLYAEPDAAEDGVLTPTLAPRQAHDDLLERTAETGLLGMAALVVLAAGVVAGARRRLRASSHEVASGAAGSLMALVVVALTSFPLEMPGTLALAAVAMGFCVTEEPNVEVAAHTRRPAARIAVVAVVLVVPWVVVRAERSVRYSRAFEEAELALHRDHGLEGARAALPRLQAALALDPDAFTPALREAHAFLRQGRATDAIDACRRALLVEPHSPNAHATLASAYLAAGEVHEAVTSATEAVALVHDYPFALDTRARAENALGEPEPALRDRARLTDLAAHAIDDDARREAREFLSP